MVKAPRFSTNTGKTVSPLTGIAFTFVCCYFQASAISKALSHYQRAYNTLDDAPGYTEDEQQSKQTLVLALSLNCALCHIKLEQWNKAIDCCEKALNIESQNEKALYRKAQVGLMLCSN